MASQLVATKLFVPQRRGSVVERQRLDALLERGADARLTLISAPAGFGKTTLVAGWLRTRPYSKRVTAWLSLDPTDNEPAAFWAHVVAALQKAVAEAGMAEIEILPTAQHSGDLELTSIVNALALLDGEAQLVLDDYHVIDHPEIQTGMAFLLEHLPPRFHIVITTRADPALPLARLRASGELVELRSADLRFTADEAASYLNGMVGLGLAAADIAALEHRTEGWIAALQLAALSMQGRSDVSGFIAGFAGTDRYVFDYLVEEVLERQSETVRSFLLDTCFLNRLSGPLCNAVTLRTDGGAMLDQLHRANLFLVPLDDRRAWYRYHQLFADVLVTQLGTAERDRLPTRHRRASDWYEANGERGEAIRHALGGGDMGRAASLMELAIPALQKNRGEATIRSWAKLLPPELVRTRPVLGIGLVGGLMSSGDVESIEPRLRDIEWGLRMLAAAGDAANSGIAFADAAELPRLPAAIELYRAALAQVRGDVPAAVMHAERVLELAPRDDHVARAAGSSFLGLTHWSQGSLEAARLAWTEGRDGLARAGHISDVLGVSLALADITLAQGRLRAAAQIFETALRLAVTPDGSVLRGTADIHAGLAALCRERNDLPAAHQHLLKSQDLGERAGLPQHPYRWRVAMAHLLHDQGDLARAADVMEEATQLYVSDFFPMVRPVKAMRMRIWLAQGRLEEALGWQRETGLSSDDELSYLREFEHISLARLLLAQADDQPGCLPAARQLLDRLLAAAERGERRGSVIEIAILSAIAHRLDVDAALVPLQRALVLAAPEGYVRLFVNEGAPMEPLLRAAVKRGIAPLYARQLLAAVAPRPVSPPRHPDLLEALSERELDVLRLLRTDLAGPEIARELSVSENTMRTHTKNIYDKLGVNSRRAAVRRAEELALLTHKLR